MSDRCVNMTWKVEYLYFGRIYLGLAIPAFIIHVLFWIQVATHRILIQMSMIWVYNYLFTDLLLLIQFFVEYGIRTSKNCVSHLIFYIFCNFEAYTASYTTILEAYMLVGLNITRYYLIVKNFNISARYPRALVLLNLCLYGFGLCMLLFQVELLQIVKLHFHRHLQSCHFEYSDMRIRIGNLLVTLFIPVVLNCYYMILTIRHVRRSQQVIHSQVKQRVNFYIKFIFFGC